MDINELEIFSDVVYAQDDIVELRLLAEGKRPLQRWITAKELPQNYPDLLRMNEQGYNVYAGINPRKHHGASGDSNVLLARYLFADFDGIEPLDGCGRWEVVSDFIFQVDLPQPDLVINSGHGIHTYWKLQEPLTELTIWKSIQDQLNLALNADKAVKNPERLMRLPGFMNVKSKPYTECFIIMRNESYGR